MQHLMRRLLTLAMAAALILGMASPDDRVNADAVNENLIWNGGFEAYKEGWEDWGATTVVEDGASHMRALQIGLGDAGSEGGMAWYIEAKPNDTFKIGGWGKASAGEVGILGIKSLGDNGPIAGGAKELHYTASDYEYREISFTAVPGTTAIMVYLYKNPGPGYVFFDDIAAYPTTPGDPNQPPQEEAVYIHNHAYLPEDWFYLPQTDRQIREYVNQLKQYYIEYQFANIGFLREDGTLDPNQSKELGHWIKVSRETDPDQKIIAWINADTVRHVHVGTEEHPAGEEDKQAMHQRIIQSVKNAVDIGFLYDGRYYKVDGIQFDIEPLRAKWKDDPELLTLLQGIRQAVGPDVHLSIAGPAWDIVWSNDYITRLANIMDMLNPMIYDTNGPDSWKPTVTQTAEEYEELWKNTALRYSNAIAASSNPDCQFSPIMPAYETKGYLETDPDAPEYGEFVIYHDPSIENIYHAARGLKQAIAEGADVYGSGIFWWGTFIMTEPDPRDHQDYSHAREWWLTEWVNNSTSSNPPTPTEINS